jgi:precorrin-3B C17-methyltransferase
MSGGSLVVVGLGPGAEAMRTRQATEALAAAQDLLGYAPYLDRVPFQPGQARHPSDNRAELARARHALALAAGGRRVAVVSGGDPGVFAMASAVFEAMEHGETDWRALDVRVVPGVSAMLAAAARLGAPLGSDFCALSLSDNLKPWEVIAARLDAAARAGFVIALYNTKSRARPWQLAAALARLGAILPPAVPVAFATAVSRPDERVVVTTLAAADPALADMRTLVLIGSAETRRIDRTSWIYSPRSSQA